jgi:hypothetical protein
MADHPTTKHLRDVEVVNETVLRLTWALTQLQVAVIPKGTGAGGATLEPHVWTEAPQDVAAPSPDAATEFLRRWEARNSAWTEDDALSEFGELGMAVI